MPKGVPKTQQDRESALRSAGLRVTHQRMLILDELRKLEHVSAEDLHRQLTEAGTSMNLATVYRVLGDLLAAGLVEKHSFRPNHSVYELARFAHHDHLICIDCNRVIEFLDPIIEQRQDEVAKKHSMEITHHTMYLYGSCTRDNCPHLEKAADTD